ncbi:hypothetical protein [Nocardia wallacei]|uniref:hypothetical protein n=1 Tax=Nocardia wallacei TaxID=480035 RepID=UPI0024587AD8|nr:hypothetical protein [Nocardia wallacei]
MLEHSTVVVGPWPGSSASSAASRWRPRPGRGIPHRYRDRWGRRQLMDCRECRVPFHPDIDVPRDRLCADCRKDRADLAPALFDAGEVSG